MVVISNLIILEMPLARAPLLSQDECTLKQDYVCLSAFGIPQHTAEHGARKTHGKITCWREQCKLC
jgi:hypothetical protein